MKRKKHKSSLITITLALAFGLVLSGCNGNSSITETGPTIQSDTTPGGSSSTTTSEPAKTFKVTIAAVTGATVTADKAEYEAGDKVVLSVDITAPEMVVDKVDAGEGVTVTEEKKDETYSFTMPSREVNVTVTLKAKEYENRKLSVNEVAGFEVSFSVAGTKVTEAKKGDEVTVSIESTSTTQRFVSLTSQDVTLNEVVEGEEYTFTMVDKDVALTLSVENIPSRELTFTGSTGVEGTFKVNDKEVTSALEGTTVTLELSWDSEIYTFESIEVEGTTLVTVETGREYTFVVGADNISISASVTPIPLYAISTNSVEGGSVKFFVDEKEVNQAKAGQVVTAKVTVEEGYEFNSLTSEDVTLTPVADEEFSYTFTMPEKAVSLVLDVQYIPKEYKVLEILDLGTWGDFSINEGDTFLEGEDVTFTFSASSYAEAYFADVNGTSYQATLSEGTTFTYSVTFTMPSEDVKIAVYEGALQVEEGITISYEESDLYSIYGVVNGGIYDADADISIYVIPNSGVLINSVSYLIDGTDSGSLYGSTQFTLSYLDNATTSYEITVDAEYVGAYDIVVTNTEGVTVEGQLDDVTAGVRVTLKVVTEEGYRIKDAGGLEYSCDNPDEVFYASISYDDSVTFTMPKGNVTLTFNLITSHELSYVEAEHISNVRFTSDEDGYSELESAFDGDTVYVHFDAEEGYYVESITIDGVDPSDITSYDNNQYFRFEMPDQDAAVHFNVIKMSRFTYDDTAYSLTGLNGAEYLIPGETYTFSIEANDGYRIVGEPVLKTVATEENPSVEVELTREEDRYGDVEYSFTAPEQDVVLEVETEAVATPTVTFNFYNLEGYDGSIYLRDSNYGYVYSGNTVDEGEELSVYGFNESYIAYGYEFDGIYLIYGGEEHKIDGTTFTAPAEDFTVEIRIVKKDTKAVTINVPEDVDVDVSVDYETIDSPDGTAYDIVAGDTIDVSLSLSYSAEDDYYMDLTTLTANDESGASVLPALPEVTDVSEYEFSIVVNDNIDITLGELKVISKYNVSIKEGSQFSDQLSVRTDYYTSSEIEGPQKEGAVLRAYLDTLTSEEFSNNTYTLEIYNAAGELIDSIEFDVEYVYYSEYYYAEFTMPAFDVYLDVVVTPNA